MARAVREKPAGVIVIVDAEDRCVTREQNGEPPLGPELLTRARRVAGGIPVAVVVANRMLEAWFLADFHSLRARDHFLLSATLARWRTPEAIGGCKGPMRDILGKKYSETTDQPLLAKHISVHMRAGLCKRAPSFFRLYREVDRISRQAG